MLLAMLSGIDSPFTVPIALFAMVLGIVVATVVADYYKRRLQSEERMAAIAKGLPLPAEPASDRGFGDSTGSRPAPRGLRTAAIVLICGSLGVAAFGILLVIILGERDIYSLTATAVVPFAIGVGLLIDYRLQDAEHARKSEDVGGAKPMSPGSGLLG